MNMAGMRGVNPRQMQQAMKKMGMKQTDLKNVIEVVIRTKDNDIFIRNAEVTCIEMQGGKSYQIAGTEEVVPSGAAPTATIASFPAEDIEIVMSQTGCEKPDAIAALEKANGQPAEAILAIMTR